MSRATFGGDIPERAGGGPTTDGGETARDDLPVGTVVLDREDDDPNRAAVVNRPPVTAGEWTAYVDEAGEEVTVADDNPSYDGTEEIVVVAFLDDLDPVRPVWAGESPLTLTDLHQDGTSTYAFPPARLEPIGVIDPAARGDHEPDEGEPEAQAQHPRDQIVVPRQRRPKHLDIPNRRPIAEIEREGDEDCDRDAAEQRGVDRIGQRLADERDRVARLGCRVGHVVDVCERGPSQHRSRDRHREQSTEAASYHTIAWER